MRDHFNYPKMVDQALRGVVRTALKRVQEQGLRGNHHMYVSFLTHFPGVVVADYLRDKYPKEMTIVLQHQFWDLEIGEDSFDLTLSFNKVPERLTIPFEAMTGFADPSVQFGLQFQPDRSRVESGKGTGVPAPITAGGAMVTVGPAADDNDDDDAAPAPAPGEKVVALDQFRKK
jgi:hypothetical protein